MENTREWTESDDVLQAFLEKHAGEQSDSTFGGRLTRTNAQQNNRVLDGVKPE